MGARIISNSYGGSEFASTSSFFSHPNHILTASSGDNGTGAQQPCSFATVVCVGGTRLVHAANTRGFSETAWSGAGSGCSALVAKPSFQHDPSCHKRSESDISAEADPATGVRVFDSTTVPGSGTCPAPNCWWIVGGTSASAPIIAGAYGLAQNASLLSNASTIWAHGGTTSFFDVVSGSNGTCSIFYICHAQRGYDGPTGWGTPNGISGL
jgi:subtilase family serine protease